MVTREAISPNGNGVATEHLHHHDPHRAIDLYLTVQDPDLCGELLKRDEPERSDFALAALRVGVMAIRQAQGQVDAHQIQDAGERVIRSATASRNISTPRAGFSSSASGASWDTATKQGNWSGSSAVK